MKSSQQAPKAESKNNELQLYQLNGYKSGITSTQLGTLQDLQTLKKEWSSWGYLCWIVPAKT